MQEQDSTEGKKIKSAKYYTDEQGNIHPNPPGPGSGQWVCSECGTVADPKKMVKGSVIVELGLWFSLLIALAVFYPAAFIVFIIALIYSIWRMTSASRGCPSCKAPNMIKTSSPMGKKLLADLEKRSK